MKINGKEVDMQKVLRLYEQEHRPRTAETKKKIAEWWDSVPGQAAKERLSARMKTGKVHRQKIKFVLIDVNNDDDKTMLYGTQAVANFLGYKNWNNTMNVSLRMNRDKTKEYQIIRLEE